MKSTYVHGYSKIEADRLYTRADAVSSLLYLDTIYPRGARVLEAGCGVGAQAVFLAGNNPGARFTCIDIEERSLETARRKAKKLKLTNIEFLKADLFKLPFRDNSFDHAFLCFVLEHLIAPAAALAELKRVLKPRGTLTAIAGDHGSCYFSPETVNARALWNAVIALHRRAGGDPLIGRRLAPLLFSAGFSSVNISPRNLYIDARKTDLMHRFVQGTLIAMAVAMRRKLLKAGLLGKRTIDAGLNDLSQIPANPLATLCYTFFKAVAEK
jgi:SAM-dependent methyltransferase